MLEDALVTRGRWSLTVADGVKLLPCSVSIGARTAFFPDHPEPCPVAQGLPLRFRARFPRRCVLRVVDAETRVDLGNLRLVRQRDWKTEDNDHPGSYSPACVVAKGVASPIQIPTGQVHRFDTGVWFHAYCAGYAWGRVQLDLTTGGERIVSLRPGGSVEVQFTGQPAAKDMVLRVRSADEEAAGPIAEFRLGSAGGLPIEGLSPGTYRIAAEIGEWFDRPRLIAETRCEVVAGERTRAVLEIPVVVRPSLVPLAGEVRVPESWQLPHFNLTLQLLDVPLVPVETRQEFSTADALKEVAGRAGVWRFDAGKVQPGLYQVRVSGAEYHTSIRVGPSGDRMVRLEVPPPGRLSVRVVDASTGKDAELEVISWHYQLPEGVTTYSPLEVRRDPDSRRFRFRAPLGQVAIAVDSDDYVGEGAQVEVVPGLTEQTLSVHPTGSILVVLKDGKASFPGWPVWESKVTQIGGDGQVVATGDREVGVRIWLNKPGRYRVELPAIPDYKAVPAQEVLVETGKVTKLVVRLSRIR